MFGLRSSDALLQSFPVRIRLPEGEQFIVRCTPGTTVTEFLREASGKIKVRAFLCLLMTSIVTRMRSIARTSWM